MGFVTDINVIYHWFFSWRINRNKFLCNPNRQREYVSLKKWRTGLANNFNIKSVSMLVAAMHTSM